MQPFSVLLVNVVIGSLIGGVTNELAIRMLFRPYKPWTIGRFRVPFTPGLIPRRKNELSVQMGRLVEHYLLTREGVSQALRQGRMEQTLQKWLAESMENWMNSERSTKEWLMLLIPSLFTEDGELREETRTFLQHRWDRLADVTTDKLKEKRLKELLPSTLVEKLHDKLPTLAVVLMEKLRGYVHSSEGMQSLQGLIRGFTGGGGGGFLGGLMGMFLSDDKVLSKILPHVDELLRNPDLAVRLTHFLQNQLDEWLNLPAEKILEWIGKERWEEGKTNIFRWLEERGMAWLDRPVREWAGDFREPVRELLVPHVSRWLMETLEHNVGKVFEKLDITSIVSRQVEGFPLERVEEMIIGITGKEFRMITILGFILGGIIGLVQGIFSLYL